MTDRPFEIVLAARPQGKVMPADFRRREMPMPVAPPGGVLLETLWLSLDPYMRGRMDDRPSYAKPTPVGEAMEGEGIARVLSSGRPDVAAGDLVLARTGWRTHWASDGEGLRKVDTRGAPLTTALGVLGMPGFTAYSGLELLGKPKSGNTVVVAAATGPVGSLVGQLAKLRGARAVGIAGGARKCRALIEEFGFDAAIDHKDPDMPAHLAAACPNGIDVYFENVGGAVWQAVLPLLNRFARVPVCGLIANYNSSDPGQGSLAATMRAILTKSLTMRGFINYEFEPEHFPAFLDEVGAAVSSGQIRYREDITEGLENAPTAFMGMLEGRNFGKVLVRVAEG